MKRMKFLSKWRVGEVFILSILIPALQVSYVHSMSSSASATRPTVLVTGSTDGIGVTTAKNMAAKGYNVLIHGRDEGRIAQAADTVRQFVEQHSNETPEIVTLPAADISTIEGCERLVESVKSTCQERELQLSVLMNNAGVYSEDLILSDNGYELTFAVNVLAPFVITSLLLPTLTQQSKSRIVIASSISQSRDVRDWDDLPFYATQSYSAHKTYSESKLLDAMLTMEFAKRLQEDLGYGNDRITCNCLDPGTVNTKMLLAGWGPCGIDVRDALDQTWLCTSKEVDTTTGQYFTWKSSRRASASAYDQKERDKMWGILSGMAPGATAMWEAKTMSESL
jgi:NAD(P)-dependent dehydrogenase (short-subunit alcohol dehydrogenase family)